MSPQCLGQKPVAQIPTFLPFFKKHASCLFEAMQPKKRFVPHDHSQCNTDLRCRPPKPGHFRTLRPMCQVRPKTVSPRHLKAMSSQHALGRAVLRLQLKSPILEHQPFLSQASESSSARSAFCTVRRFVRPRVWNCARMGWVLGFGLVARLCRAWVACS